MTIGGNFSFPWCVVAVSDAVEVCVSFSVSRMENGFSGVKFGVVLFV
jgi:hypothetical protein